jgi:hypothetical protein
MRLFFLAALCAAPLLVPRVTRDREAFERFDFFPAAHAILDHYISAHPDEPLPYAVRACRSLL